MLTIFEKSSYIEMILFIEKETIHSIFEFFDCLLL